MKFAVISFYTEGYYEWVMNNYLHPTLLKYNLMYIIKKYNSLKNWEKNTNLKPLFIKECMENYIEFDYFIWIDADGKIEKFPDLFYDYDYKKYDMGIHFLDLNKWYNRNSFNKKELLTGTLFISNNLKTYNVVSEWARVSELNKNIMDQRNLESVINKYSLNILELPLEYCYIYQLPNGKDPFVKVENPVIVHYQASRKIKKGDKHV